MAHFLRHKNSIGLKLDDVANTIVISGILTVLFYLNEYNETDCYLKLKTIGIIYVIGARLFHVHKFPEYRKQV